MKYLVALLLIVIFPPVVRAADLFEGPERTAQIDHLVESSIAKGTIAGGVVLVGNGREILFEKAYGRTATLPDALPMRTDTLFDLASLTKVVATTPSILKLAEEGSLSLVDPVTKWLPEFVGTGKDDLLILHLLTHTSGLDDVSLGSTSPRQAAISRAAAERPKGELGSRFRYADINFILLGEIVSRASGRELDRFAASAFYSPLGMTDTGFRPDAGKLSRTAATLTAESVWLVGRPQDYPARQLGDVAGHAGLFSTARDLATFCHMLLNEGEWSGKRVLSARAVRQMTAPYFSRGGKIARGLGWDISSPYSSPRGDGFSEVSFGHTGYSGASIWVDPEADLFVVLLTSRLEYKKISEISWLRGELSSLSVRLFSPPHVEDTIAGVAAGGQSGAQ